MWSLKKIITASALPASAALQMISSSQDDFVELQPLSEDDKQNLKGNLGENQEEKFKYLKKSKKGDLVLDLPAVEATDQDGILAQMNLFSVAHVKFENAPDEKMKQDARGAKDPKFEDRSFVSENYFSATSKDPKLSSYYDALLNMAEPFLKTIGFSDEIITSYRSQSRGQINFFAPEVSSLAFGAHQDIKSDFTLIDTLGFWGLQVYVAGKEYDRPGDNCQLYAFVKPCQSSSSRVVIVGFDARGKSEHPFAERATWHRVDTTVSGPDRKSDVLFLGSDKAFLPDPVAISLEFDDLFRNSGFPEDRRDLYWSFWEDHRDQVKKALERGFQAK